MKYLDKKKLILVFGRDGQVGKALQKLLSDYNAQVIFLGRDDCDLAKVKSINEALAGFKPKIIINAAAYTNVDRAEYNAKLAFSVNSVAPKIMAEYIAKIKGGILVHFSTDYVFADTKKNAYVETDLTGPIEELCVYGRSKLLGEYLIEKAFQVKRLKIDLAYQSDELSKYYILRTSWVYGDGDNFIKNILHLAHKKNFLKIVNDQKGAPCSAEWLAGISLQVASLGIQSGVYHVVPDGETSWHGLAKFIIKVSQSYRKDLYVKAKNILPIKTNDFSKSAKRPKNSRLDNTKLKNMLSKISQIQQYPHWKDQVREYTTSILEVN